MKAADIFSLLKRVIIGPECTGKSELTKVLAEHFKTTFVEEYARGYINGLNRHYEKSDLTEIAFGQARLEDEAINTANRVVICDTNPIVIKVWSEFKYGDCSPEIRQTIVGRRYDLYLLTYIDVPWENDPQREHPDKREQFWQIFKSEVEETGVPYVIIKGPREEREKKAIHAIETLLDE